MIECIHCEGTGLAIGCGSQGALCNSENDCQRRLYWDKAAKCIVCDGAGELSMRDHYDLYVGERYDNIHQPINQ